MNIIECPGCQSRYDAYLTNPGDSFHCQCGQQFFIPDLPKQAKSWNCPSCAGAISPNDQQCEYCGVFLSFARCPSCFSLAMIKNAKYCSECGKSLKVPAKPLKSIGQNYGCPRCKNTILVGQSSGQFLIHGCDKCGGIWINHKALERIVKLANKPSVDGALGKISKDFGELENHDVTYLPCPECRELMYRRNFASNSNIIIDECNKHGVWFDNKELAAAINHLRSKFTMKPKLSDTGENENAEEDSGNNLVFTVSEEDLNLLLEEYPELFSTSHSK